MHIVALALLVLLTAASHVRADEKLPRLKVGSETYTNVTVTMVTATDIVFTHSGGMGSAKLKNLDPALQKHFGYDPGKAWNTESAQTQASHQPRQQATNPAAAPAASPQNHNCAIKIPAGWRILDPPPPKTLTAASSPDGRKTVSLSAITVRDADLPIALGQMIENVKSAFASAGLQAVEGQTTLAGVSFHTFTSKTDNKATSTAFIALAGHELYVLEASSEIGDVTSDPELQSIVGSFRLLSTAKKAAEKPAPNGTAYRVSYTMGRFPVLPGFGLLLLGWILFGLYFAKLRFGKHYGLEGPGARVTALVILIFVMVVPYFVTRPLTSFCTTLGLGWAAAVITSILIQVAALWITIVLLVRYYGNAYGKDDI